MMVFDRTINWSQDLFTNFKPIRGMNVAFSVTTPSHLFVSGHIDVQHRKLIRGPVMVAFILMLDGRWLLGSKTGENIVSPADHYYSAQIHGYSALKVGKHTIALYGRSASSLSTRNGLAEVKPGIYNQMIVRIEE